MNVRVNTELFNRYPVERYRNLIKSEFIKRNLNAGTLWGEYNFKWTRDVVTDLMITCKNVAYRINGFWFDEEGNFMMDIDYDSMSVAGSHVEEHKLIERDMLVYVPRILRNPDDPSQDILITVDCRFKGNVGPLI